MMKKFLTSMLLLSSLSLSVLFGAANAGTANTVGKPQVRIEFGQRRRHRDRWYRNRGYARGNRIGYGRTFTRDVQRGWRIYRETYQVRYLPNGMTQTVLISRVRLN